jgi:hypothetical protein
MADKDKNKALGAVAGLNLDDDEEEDFLTKSLNSNQAAKEATRRSKTKKDKTATAEVAAKKAKQRSAKRTVGAAAAKKAAVKNKDEAAEELKTSIEKLSADPQVQAKLAKMIDPKTPMKERLELEVAMMRHPVERKVLADFRYKKDRTSYLVNVVETQEHEEEQLNKNLAQEAVRAGEENKYFAKKREEKIEEEIAGRERDAQLERDVRHHKAKAIAMNAEQLRKDAEQTVEIATKNKAVKERKEKDREEKLNRFRENEGKNMTDVERALYEARLMQRSVNSDDDSD